MPLCVICSTLYSQTNKDLNSPERVKALYGIAVQHKELTKQVKDCQDRYNAEMQLFENKYKQIQDLNDLEFLSSQYEPKLSITTKTT